MKKKWKQHVYFSSGKLHSVPCLWWIDLPVIKASPALYTSYFLPAGQFIMSGILVCPPSNEKLHIQSSELLPAAKETRKKTSKLKSVAKEEEEESGGEEEEEEEEQATAEQK